MYHSFIDMKPAESSKNDTILKKDGNPASGFDPDSPKEAFLDKTPPPPPPPAEDSSSDIEELSSKKRSNFHWSPRIRQSVAYAAVICAADGSERNKDVYEIFLKLLKKDGHKDSPPFGSFKKHYGTVKNMARQLYKLKQMMINIKGTTDTEKMHLKPEYDKLDEELHVLRRELYGKRFYEIDSSVEANYNCLGKLLESDMEECVTRERIELEMKKMDAYNEARGLAFGRGDSNVSGRDSDGDLTGKDGYMAGDSPSRTPRNRTQFAKDGENNNSNSTDKVRRQIEEKEEDAEVGTRKQKKVALVEGHDRHQKRSRQAETSSDEVEEVESIVPSTEGSGKRHEELRPETLGKVIAGVAEILSSAVVQKLDEPLRKIAESMNNQTQVMNAILEFMKSYHVSNNK